MSIHKDRKYRASSGNGEHPDLISLDLRRKVKADRFEKLILVRLKNRLRYWV